MSRIRLGLFTTLAMIVISVVSAATASAAFTLLETACSGAVPGLCWSATEAGELLELNGEEQFSATGGLTLLEANFGANVVHIECTNFTTSGGVINQEVLVKTTAEVKLHFTGCALVGSLGEKCKVLTELLTETLLATFPEAGDVVFKGDTNFIIINIAGIAGKGCPAIVEGNQAVKGEQICLWLTPSEDLLTQELNCPSDAEHSKLTLGGNAATFDGEAVVTPTNLNDFWDIVLQ